MLAGALRLGLLGLAAVAFAAAWWIGSHSALGAVATVLLAAAMFFAVPAVMILLTFAVSWPHRSIPPPELRIGPLAAIRCVLHEIFGYTAVYVFLQPFPRLALPPELPVPVRDRPAVILVHGYACNGAVWAWLARRLGARGHAVYTVTLEPVFAHIDDYVGPLEQKVKEIAGETGRVALVAHSMGGLVCRAYLRRCGGTRIARLVTLGAPHHGSALAPIGYGGDAEDMRPMAEWLRGLSGAEQAGLAVPITSIYSCHDNFVVPQESSVLAGARNVPLAGLGHLSLLFSERVAALVEAELRG